MNLRTYIKRHSVLIYFFLTFLISWTAVLGVVGSGGIPGRSDQFEKNLLLTVMAMLAGPSLASVLLTVLIDGKTGLRELWSRLFRWRVSGDWYVAALITAPLCVTTILFAFSFVSHAFLPALFTTNDKTGLLLSGFMAGAIVGIFEELGWSGFAAPRLRQRYSTLMTGLIVGLLWGAWHVLVTYWGSGTTDGKLSLAVFLPGMTFAFGVLPAYRILMVWVYDRTKSLPIAMLMHASLTSSTVFILTPSATGIPLILYNLVLTAVLWLLIANVLLQSVRKPI